MIGIKNIFKKARKTTGATKISWKENKAIKRQYKMKMIYTCYHIYGYQLSKTMRILELISGGALQRIVKINFTIKCIG